MESHGVRSFTRKCYLGPQLDPEDKSTLFSVGVELIACRFSLLRILYGMPGRRRIRASPCARHGTQFFLLQSTPPLQPRLSFSFE